MDTHLKNMNKSFNDLKTTPIIIVPSVMLVSFLFFMGILVMIQAVLTVDMDKLSSGMEELQQKLEMDRAGLPAEDYENMDLEIDAFLQQFNQSVNSGLLTLFLLIDLIIYALAIAYYRSAHYGVINDIAKRGSSSFGRMIQHGKNYFLKMLTYSLAKNAITLGILAFLLLMPYVMFKAEILSEVSAAIIGMAVFTIWLVCILLPVNVMTTFALPMVFDKKKGGFQILTECLAYSKKHFGYVMLTWLIVFILPLAFYYAATIIKGTLLILAPFALLDAILELIFVLTGWAISILLNFYVFNSYLFKSRTS